ncbi:DUF3558 family protein [Nocardia sp. CA-290969]|uniref:DUF3558 family protein n=1 Tax=Nocardia sp. CA-290969 TaxID=3239986 RepID=UPI003D8B796D
MSWLKSSSLRYESGIGWKRIAIVALLLLAAGCGTSTEGRAPVPVAPRTLPTGFDPCADLSGEFVEQHDVKLQSRLGPEYTSAENPPDTVGCEYKISYERYLRILLSIQIVGQDPPWLRADFTTLEIGGRKAAITRPEDASDANPLPGSQCVMQLEMHGGSLNLNLNGWGPELWENEGDPCSVLTELATEIAVLLPPLE